MLVSIIFTVILNLIAMGSNIAYNMLLTLNVSGLMTSYLICVACTSHSLLNFQGFSLTRSRCLLPPQLGRASTPIALQPRQDRRQCHQRDFHVVLSSCLDFPIFPSCAQPISCGHELGICSLRLRPDRIGGILCFPRKIQIQGSGRECEEGSVKAALLTVVQLVSKSCGSQK